MAKAKIFALMYFDHMQSVTKDRRGKLPRTQLRHSQRERQYQYGIDSGGIQ